uniref:Uncharacterized protein n=1 Tax=Oryza nivara TaxID=4536 RepID=A0A0E0HV60_ORYNI
MAMSRRSDVRRGPCICGMPQARRSETATSFGCGRSMGLRGREAGGANGKARERAAWRGVTRPHQLQAIEQERTLQSAKQPGPSQITMRVILPPCWEESQLRVTPKSEVLERGEEQKGRVLPLGEVLHLVVPANG